MGLALSAAQGIRSRLSTAEGNVNGGLTEASGSIGRMTMSRAQARQRRIAQFKIPAKPITNVYFVQSVATHAIKIGKANDVGARKRDLQTGTDRELILLGSIPADASTEGELHGMFEHLQIRGEWFSPGPELLAFIRQHGQPASVVDLHNLHGRLFASVPEVSAILGLDQQGRTVRKAIRAGEIPFVRVGATYRIPVSWLREQAALPESDAAAARAARASIEAGEPVIPWEQVKAYPPA